MTRPPDTPDGPPCPPLPVDPSRDVPLPATPIRSLEPQSPLNDIGNRSKRKRYQNGWEATPKPPSFSPYALTASTRKRLKSMNTALPEVRPISAHPALTKQQWTTLANTASWLPEGSTLRDFQMECSNVVVSQLGDVVVIAPTGAGKSLLWCLPLLVIKNGISLVITPYTSLGLEGEQRTNALGLRAVFIHANQCSDEIMTDVAQGEYRVVFVCAEMLESPIFATILHAKRFQARLTAIYIDEAHLVHESLDWRTSYSRLHQLRRIVSSSIPLIPISATLPSAYRDSLCQHAGLQKGHRLINLGNFRPELMTAVVSLQHDASSFLDLAFVVPESARAEDIAKTIIYCDNVETLTKMFWWFTSRLRALNLSTSVVEILHAGLSSRHEETALEDFRMGHARILLGSEKIGAGLNFPNVTRVIVYLVQPDLTLAKFEQRKGRAGRTEGTSGIGILMVQADLFDGEVSDAVIASLDPGIWELISTRDRCLDEVLDQHLENLAQQPIQGWRCCCNCYPSLYPAHTLLWVMVDPKSVTSTSGLSAEEVGNITKDLKEWRTEMWKIRWREMFLGFGPEDLISDEDLEAVARRITVIKSLDDLRPVVHIAYWTELASSLLVAVSDAATKLPQALEPELNA
ncbi:P-loop containing nucleoside triphosphate hydrolase protein [Trametopsis cervina]|nr:P-loop containing nucleoside triphosphate hydrolase protein [Trametopsis cervina]